MANIQESIERFDSTGFGLYAENISDLRKENRSLSQGEAYMTEEIAPLKAEVQELRTQHLLHGPRRLPPRQD